MTRRKRLLLNLNRFGLGGDQAGRVSDVMAKAFGSSALDAEKLEEAMKTAGPVASSVGFSLEEVTGILGVLADNGISRQCRRNEADPRAECHGSGGSGCSGRVCRVAG